MQYFIAPGPDTFTNTHLCTKSKQLGIISTLMAFDMLNIFANNTLYYGLFLA